MKDALAALELARQIGMPQDVLLALQVQSETLELAALEPLLSALGDPAQNRQAYVGLKTALGEDADGWKMLWCQLVCASRQRKRYETGAIYVETMKAFSRFVNECRRRTGKYRFDRGWWTWRQVSGRVVRLGALEYEKRTREGQKVIDIHIPSDASLVPERVDASLKEARRYFDDSAKIPWTCDSWLLSPALRPLFAQKTRISARFRTGLLFWRPTKPTTSLSNGCIKGRSIRRFTRFPSKRPFNARLNVFLSKVEKSEALLASCVNPLWAKTVGSSSKVRKKAGFFCGLETKFIIIKHRK